jgi:hypothetical protein
MAELFFSVSTVLAPDRIRPTMLQERVPDGARLPTRNGLPDTAGMCDLSLLMRQYTFAKALLIKRQVFPIAT